MQFTGVDVGVAVLVLISAILATARGFTREILSLATWAGSAAIAAYMYFNHRNLLAPYFADELLRTGVTVIGSFLIALIVLHLLTMWIGDLVVDSRVGPLDRTLGFVFGAARGVLICVVAAVFAVFLLGPEERLPDMLKDAKSRPPLEAAGDYLIGLLPPDIEEQFRTFLETRNGTEGDVNDTTNDQTGSETTPPAETTTEVPAPSSEENAA